MPAVVVGTPRSFWNRFKFLVEIGGITYAGFQKCSELSKELARIDHWEGGRSTAHKSPGRLTIPSITLERGATVDLELYQWFEQTMDASVGLGVGAQDPFYKRELDIVQLERDDSVVQRFHAKGAWPEKFVAGAWDNTSDEKVMTSVTLAIDDFTPVFRPA